MAGGWFLVVGMESLYYLLTAGNLLYRVHTVFVTHWSLGRVLTLNYAAGTGNIVHNRVFGPPLALLVNQEFGLLFYMAVPAALATCFGSRLSEEQRRLARLLAGIAIVWFVVVGYMLDLHALPRYFSVPTFAAVLLVAMWLSCVRHHHSRSLAWLLGAGLVATNLLSIHIENRDPLFGERALVRFVSGTGEIVYTDPYTLHRAKQLLIWAGDGLSERVRSTPVPAGSLFVFYPKNAAKGYVPGGDRFDPDLYRPGAAWPEIWRADPPDRLVGIISKAVRIDRVVPAS
jgi:hypothetical protein